MTTTPAPEAMQKIKVHIRKNSTQEIRVYETEADREFSDFIWTEGNFACDCNRSLFFNNWEGPDQPCGDTEYSIPKIILEDGREIKIDE